jgi:hypothetical protein
MIRKLLMVAAAAAVPMGAIAAGVGGGIAGAALPIPVVPTTCHMTGTVTFASPGISLIGITTTAKTSSTTSSVGFTGCASGGTVGGGGTLNILTKNTKCVLPVTGTEPANCAKGLLVTDSGGGLGSPGTFKSLGKAIKALPLTLTEGAHVFTLKSKALSEGEVVGGACTNGSTSEVGFSIQTSVKGSPKETGVTGATILVCLGQDSNSANFETDLLTNGATIASTQIDPVTSSITLHA